MRVTPRAGRDELAGWHDGRLRVRLIAPPLDGRANEALIQLIARALDLPPRAVRIISGENAREKRLAIAGIDEATLRARLGVLLTPDG